MTQVQTRPAVSTEALEALATLQQLTLEAGLSADRRQLIFRILNRSVVYCRYDRAVLWGLAGRAPQLLGVSGAGDANAQAPLVVAWRRVVGRLPNREAATLLGSGDLRPAQRPDATDAWDQLSGRTGGLSVAWVPICVAGRAVAGLWLERWGAARFSPSDLTRLEALALAYGVAWRAVAQKRSSAGARLASRRGVAVGILAAAVIAALGLIRVPLRVVAPCEVVPNEPIAVTAPLNGVIEEVKVLPGRPVQAGDLLAVYDRRVSLEEIKVVQQQVQIIESDLQRARVQAFTSPEARAQVALLENRLAQERVRLGLAQHRVAQLEIHAPVAGTPMFDDPELWRGRPVQIGERLMMIVDPQNTKVRIWLPEHDNIVFDQTQPVAVVLHADPRASRPATLRFLANHSEVNTAGQTGFRAEAEWQEPTPDVKTGLQGTAVLHGSRVSLGYWLLRRPLATIRRSLGV